MQLLVDETNISPVFGHAFRVTMHELYILSVVVHWAEIRRVPKAYWSTLEQFYTAFYRRTMPVRVRVRVTLQLTVSQSVCLGVEPNLGLLTRDIFFL
jgi:hypothetical protein